jgi:hypothetical protein
MLSVLLIDDQVTRFVYVTDKFALLDAMSPSLMI